MAKSPCNCKKSPECEECPEWIFTFADLVMLMMGFFVILWVLKPNPGKDSKPQEQQEEWLKVVAAIRGSFGYIADPKSSDPVDRILLRMRQHEKPDEGAGKGGDTRVKRRGAEGTDPEVTTVRQGHQAAVGGRLLFEAGDAKLTPDTARSLDWIAEYIRGHRNIMLVKGHTALDDFPDTSSPTQRMDLSIRRAQAVADYLTSHGVSPEMLRVQGCSTFEPVAQQAYSSDVLAQNRRVEVEETDRLVEDMQDRNHPATTMPADAKP